MVGLLTEHQHRTNQFWELFVNCVAMLALCSRSKSVRLVMIVMNRSHGNTHFLHTVSICIDNVVLIGAIADQ